MHGWDRQMKGLFVLITLEDILRSDHPSENTTFRNTAKQGQGCLLFSASHAGLSCLEAPSTSTTEFSELKEKKEFFIRAWSLVFVICLPSVSDCVSRVISERSPTSCHHTVLPYNMHTQSHLNLFIFLFSPYLGGQNCNSEDCSACRKPQPMQISLCTGNF